MSDMWTDLINIKERIESLEKTQITKVFYEQWVDKLTELEKKFEAISSLKIEVVHSKELKEQIAELREGLSKEIKSRVNWGKAYVKADKEINELKGRYEGVDANLTHFVRMFHKTTEVLQDHLNEHVDIAEADRDDQFVIAKWEMGIGKQLEKLDSKTEKKDLELEKKNG